MQEFPAVSCGDAASRCRIRGLTFGTNSENFVGGLFPRVQTVKQLVSDLVRCVQLAKHSVSDLVPRVQPLKHSVSDFFRVYKPQNRLFWTLYRVYNSRCSLFRALSGVYNPQNRLFRTLYRFPEAAAGVGRPMYGSRGSGLFACRPCRAAPASRLQPRWISGFRRVENGVFVIA